MKQEKNVLYINQILVEWLVKKEDELKQSSYIKYRNIVYNHLLPAFEHMLIDSLTPIDFETFIMNKRKDTTINKATVKLIYLILKSAIAYANTTYHCDIQTFTVDIQLDYKKPMILSIADCHMIENQCRKKINSLSVAVYLSLYAGLRIGEICALQVQDIDVIADTITVSKTIQRIQTPESAINKTNLVIDTPKSTTSCRIVPIPSDLLHHIIKPYSKDCVPTNYLLSKTDQPTDPRNIQANFKRLCTKLDLHANFLSLRHTFATNCLKQGIDIHLLSQILGHSNVSVTSALYSSLLHDKANQKQLINNLWNNNECE